MLDKFVLFGGFVLVAICSGIVGGFALHGFVMMARDSVRWWRNR